MELLIFILELVGSAAFGASGAMTGIQKNMDMFGVSILGVTTAVGGGIIRDLVLGITPPKTFQDPIYAAIAILTSILLFLVARRGHFIREHGRVEWILLIMDTLGLGAFTVTGIAAAMGLPGKPNLFLLCFVGVVTGVGGGVLRDVLAGNTPYIFVKHVYASASLLGALVCVGLWPWTGDQWAMPAGMAVVILLRLLSAYFRWNLPKAQEGPRNRPTPPNL